nr:alpha-tocopherol transfer protein-like isoform X1 [Danaus plexippus plexippus]
MSASASRRQMTSQDVQPISLEEEYRKKTGISPEDIQKLRSWMQTQPHLPENYITDLDLILAFHSCDCSSGLTKQVLDTHYTLRTLFPCFKDRRVDQVIETAETVLLIPLPTPAKHGYKINYSHVLKTDPKSFNFSETVKALFMIIDVYQYEEGTWPGFLFVVDFEGISLGHLGKIDLQSLQHVLYFLQEAMLVKLKGMHFINAPSFIDKLLLMMRPFLKKELMDMLHIHTTGSNKLQNFIDIEALPKEAGGSYKSIHGCKDDVIAKLKKHADFFEKEKYKRVTESLRPGRPKTITDIFGGIEGSFKKLEID